MCGGQLRAATSAAKRAHRARSACGSKRDVVRCGLCFVKLPQQVLATHMAAYHHTDQPQAGSSYDADDALDEAAELHSEYSCHDHEGGDADMMLASDHHHDEHDAGCSMDGDGGYRDEDELSESVHERLSAADHDDDSVSSEADSVATFASVDADTLADYNVFEADAGHVEGNTQVSQHVMTACCSQIGYA